MEKLQKLKIAIPNKGRMSDDIFSLLQKAGLAISKPKSRILMTEDKTGAYEIIFLRTQDIPSFIEKGIADVGFTGWDIVQESETDVEKLLDLDFGFCKMIVATKENNGYNSIADLPDGLKVATSFPNIAKKHFGDKKIELIEVSGATEITPDLGLADVIVDITSSGSTLKANKLKIIDEIMTSSAVIIANKEQKQQKNYEIGLFIQAIKSAIYAKEKKYLMANVPKISLDKAKEIMPGWTSPTICILLGDDENVAMHVVVDSDKVNEGISKLKQLNATGILVMTVDQINC